MCDVMVERHAITPEKRTEGMLPRFGKAVRSVGGPFAANPVRAREPACRRKMT